VSRRWRLTPRAEDALVEIALWTIRRFGPGQADIYEAELIARCEALARGDLAGQDCSVLAGEGRGLRFIRAGRHFVVYTVLGEEVVVLDVIHGRADLPRRLKALHGVGPR
jgi:plasmid stabilization system protein ParE